MILIESLGNILPTRTSGKIVGIAQCRDHVIVACEFGLYELWDDDFGHVVATRKPDDERQP